MVKITFIIIINFFHSHPKYRMALNKKFPCLVCGKLEDDKSDSKSVVSAQTNISEDKV